MTAAEGTVEVAEREGERRQENPEPWTLGSHGWRLGVGRGLGEGPPASATTPRQTAFPQERGAQGLFASDCSS